MASTITVPTPPPVRIRIKVECLECAKKFSCGPTASPECPRCGSTDIDVRENG